MAAPHGGDKGKPKGGGGGSSIEGLIIELLPAIGILAAIIFGYNFFRNGNGYIGGIAVKSVLESVHHVWLIASTVISMMFIAGIIFVLTRTVEFHSHEAKVLKKQFDSFGGEAKTMSGRWSKIEEYIASNAPSDWKVAILEADAMLDEILDRQGYYGDTLGEKLKNADPRTFPFLDTAWEAHKYRNEIAHGRDLDLSRTEAERIIKLFETVFRGVGEI